MNRQTFYNILYVALIVGILLFMFFMFIYLTGEATQCISHPLKFFESKQAGVECFCIDVKMLKGDVRG